jgi:protein TonB
MRDRLQRRNDVVGISVSLVVHACFLIALSIFAVAAADPEPIGFIEVDFGPIQEGRPVRSAPQVEDVPESEVVQEELAEEEEPEASPPEEASPVELPDQNPDVEEDLVETSDSEVISPETDDLQTDEIADEPTEQTEAVAPLGSGALAGAGSAATGDDGVSNNEQRSSPFQIEGLNRTPVSAPLPAYSEKVNALIRIRITVDPNGRIVQQIPLIKGNAALEQSVMEALRRWRFSPLPSVAPQENQTGVVTFRFTLE